MEKGCIKELQQKKKDMNMILNQDEDGRKLVVESSRRNNYEIVDIPQCIPFSNLIWLFHPNSIYNIFKYELPDGQLQNRVIMICRQRSRVLLRDLKREEETQDKNYQR